VTVILLAGRCNRPDAVTVGPDGSFYVTGSLIGGWTTKLQRIAS
jgi:hypothetical protein